jgi:hypothetical protein
MPSYLVEFEDGRKFRVKSKNPLTTEEATQYALGQQAAPAQQPGPPDSGQGRTTSFLSSVGRGAASIVPGVIGGAGYLTGSEGLIEAADTIEAGINRALPVNPAYEDEFLMKAGQALGQVVPMVATGGTAGAVGKSMALARGVAMPAAKAAGTQLAGRVMLGSGMLQGTRGGGQAAEQYGMEGGAAYARALLGGAIEGATEKYMFGLGTELAPVKKLIGDALDKGAAGIAKAATTEGAEEAVAEIGGNLGTTLLAPSGVETPGMFAGAGEAAALGAIAGGALGGFNAALGGDATPTVEGTAVVQPPAPIQEEERLEAESAIELAIAKMQAPTAVSPVGTLSQEPGETGEAFLGRVDAQRESLAKGLEAAVAQTVETNNDVLPMTNAALKSEVAAPAVDPVQAARARLRGTASATEQADMRAQLQRAEDEGILADVFAEERQRAVAREDAQRRLAELDAERARLEQEIAAQEPPTQPSEQPQPEPPVVEEAVPPVEPIPAVEEAPAAQTDTSDGEADEITRQDLQKAQSKFLQFRGKSVGAGLAHMVKFPDGKVRKVTPFEWDRLNAPDETPEATVNLINENKIGKLTRHQSEQYNRYRFEAKRKGFKPSASQIGETLDLLKKLNPPEGVTVYLRRIGRSDLLEPTPTPPITEGNFPETENVVAPAGEAEVGLGMEETEFVPMPGVLPGGDKPTPTAPKVAYEKALSILRSKTDNVSLIDMQRVHAGVAAGLTPEEAVASNLKEAAAHEAARAAVDTGIKEGRIEPGVAAQQEYDRAYNEALKPQTQPVAEKQAAETPGKEEAEGFSPDDVVLFRSPFMDADEEVSYRGPLGSDKSVIVTSKGNQISVNNDWIRKQGTKYTKPAAQVVQEQPAVKAPAEVEKPTPKTKTELIEAIIGKPPSDYTLKQNWKKREATYKKLTKEQLVDAYQTQVAFDRQQKELAEKTREWVDEIEADVKSQANWRGALGTIAERNGLSNWTAMMDNSRGDEIYRLSKWLAERKAPLPSKKQPPTAPAPQAQQPAPQRDTSKPEQMTPEERGDSIKPQFANWGTFKSKKAAQAVIDERIANLPKEAKIREIAAEYNLDISDLYGVGKAALPNGDSSWGVGVTPKHEIAVALQQKIPVSKAAVDAYGIALPEGYVADGELYVYRPEGGKVGEAPAPASAPKESSSLLAKLGEGWQIDGTVISKSGFGHWTEKQRDEARTVFNKAGIRTNTSTPNGSGNRKSSFTIPSEDARRIQDEIFAEEVKLREAKKEQAKKAEADKQAEELSKIDPAAQQWMESLFGRDDFANPTNKVYLSDFVTGKASKFAGMVNPRWLEGVQAAGATLEGGRVDFDALKKSFEAFQKTETGPTKPKVTTKLVTEEKAAELKRSIKRKIGTRTNMLLDTSLFADAVILGTYYVEKGARTFAAFSKEMIDDIGEAIRENLEDIYNAIKAQPGFDTTGMDKVGTTAAEPPPASQPAPEPQAAAAPPPPVQPPPPPAAAATAPAPLEGPVSITNAQLNQVAEILGLPQLETPQDGPYSWKSAWADAQAQIAGNMRRGSELVSEMLIRPREPSPVEVPILLHEAVVRTNAYNAAVEAQANATAGEQEAANQRVADAINALADVQQASAVMGTISARALNFRKMSAWMDFSLANMVLRLKGAKQADLSKEEMKDAQDTDKLIKAKQKEIAEKEASAGAQAELTSIFDETLKEAVSLAKKNANDLIIQSRAAAKQGKSMKDFLVEKREEAKKRIRQRGNNLNVGLNPADLLDHAIIMASYIAEGVVSLADLTAKMVGDFGPNVEKHIPQIKKEADAIVAAEQQVFEAPEAGTAKSYADQLRDSQGDDLSDRWVYNRVKEWLVEQGPDALKRPSKDLLNEAFAVVTKEVNEFDSTITEQQLRDMFSGYGKVKFPNPDEAAKKLRQMRRLELLFDKLVRARAGVPPLRAGLQRDETTPEEREALRLLNDAMKELDIPHAPSSGNIKTSLDAVKTRLKNSIDDLNKQIKDRKRAERPRKEVEYDEEAKALEAQRDKLQELLDQIDPPRPPTVQGRIEARLKDLDKQIASLKEKVAAKDYKPKQNETPITEQIQVRTDERDALSKTLKDMRIEAEGLPVLTQEQVNEMAQRNLTRQIDALEEQIRKRDFLPKEGLKPEETPEYLRLRAKVEALREQRDKIKEDLGIRRKQKTDEELVEVAVKSAEKSIVELDRRIAAGELDAKKRPSRTPETPELKALRDRRKTLQENLKDLRKARDEAAKDPVAEKIKADRKQLERMIKTYEEKIKKGDFRKRPKIAKEYDDSLMQLEIDLDNIKAEWSKKVFEAHLASRPRLTQMVDTGKQVLNTSRAILTSMDLSAVLRQGGFIGLGNPIRAARNIAPMLRAFTSDDVAKASLKRIKQRPNWKNYNLAGLYIAETDQTKMSAQEEAFMSRWVDKIPGGAKGLFIGSLVRGSQRAYLTFLNNLRADTFDSMLNQLQKGPTPTREEMESIAKYINVATGRGDLGKGALNQAAVGLNTIFFAPRLVASRFQIIGGMPIFKATGRTKALVLQEYAKFLMGATIVYALAGMAQDDDDEPLEFDPRSSDFLKVRYGDTRVDPLGGLIQATVFTSRIISGETKSAKGKIVPIRDTMRLANLFRDVPRTDKVPYGGRNVFNVGADFMRTKFSPAFGGFVDLTVGENVIGEPVTPLDIAYKMTIPMSFDEARETMEVHGMPKGPALTTLMLFGAGVQTYSDRKK